MKNNTINPLTILGNELLRYCTGQTLDFQFDGRLTGIVGMGRQGISSEVQFIYRDGHLLGVEVFSQGPALGPNSRPTDVCAASFHIVERDNHVTEILSDRTIQRGKRHYLREHLYRQYYWTDDRLTSIVENQRKEPALRIEYSPEGWATMIRGDRWNRSIAYNDRGQIKTDVETYDSKVIRHHVIEYSSTGYPIQKFAVDRNGHWALDCKYSVGEDVPESVHLNDTIAAHFFDGATGRLRLRIRGNLQDAPKDRQQFEMTEFARNPGSYLVDYNGSLDLALVSPDGHSQMHVLKLSDRLPELVQVITCEQGHVTRSENAPGLGFNQCIANVKARPAQFGILYMAPTTIADFPGEVSV